MRQKKIDTHGMAPMDISTYLYYSNGGIKRGVGENIVLKLQEIGKREKNGRGQDYLSRIMPNEIVAAVMGWKRLISS